jgi:hypothetical protein
LLRSHKHKKMTALLLGNVVLDIVMRFYLGYYVWQLDDELI